MTQARNPYVFVIGCPRSGTTLLQRMLNAHPDLAVTNDTHFITRAVKRLDVSPTTPLTDEILSSVRSYRRFPRLGLTDHEVDDVAATTDTYVDFVSGLYDRVAGRESKRLAGEKTPDFCRSIPLLADLFPWAHFVHIIRDGRDVALSTLSWAQGGKGPSSWSTWETSPVGTCALWWLWQTGRGIRDGRRIPDRYHEVTYSELTARPEPSIRTIAACIGIRHAHSMVQFAAGKTKSDPSLSAKSAWLPPTTGLRDWRTQMRPDDVELFECIAGDLLDELGFERCFPTFCETVRKKADALRAQAEKLKPVKRTARSKVPASGQPKARSDSQAGQVSGHDRRLIERDSSIPGLGLILDGDRLAARLGSVLEEPIDSLVPVYVRYKPATNCLVGYEARSHGSTYRLYAKAHAGDELDKLRKASAKASKSTRLGPSTLILEKHGVVVRLFPLDAKLTELWRLEDDPSQIVDRLFEEPPDVDRVSFEPIRWKPERRLVVRMDVAGRNHAAIKFMTYGSFGRVWNFARRRSMLQNVDSPSLIGHSKRLQAVAYEWLDGQVLAEAMNQPSFSAHRLDGVADMLGRMHANTPKRIPTILPAQTIQELRIAAAAVESVTPGLAANACRVVERAAEAMAVSAADLTLVHGDFYAKQVLVNDDAVVLLDFDAAAIGNRHLDLGNFVAHLRRDQLRGRIGPSRADESEARFIEAYRASQPAVDERLLRACVAGGLLRLAPHPFRFRESNWYAQTEALLEMAERYLEPVPTRIALHASASPEINGISDDAREREKHLSELETQALDRQTTGPRLTTLLETKGLPRLAFSRADVLRRRPGRRCLIEYSLIDSGASTSTTVLGKIREKGLDERAFGLAQTLYADGFGPRSDDGVKVPAPLGAIPELHMWLQEHVAAIPVSRILDADPQARFGARTAKALYKLHARGPEVSRFHRPEDELAILKDALADAAQIHPMWQGRLDRLYEQAERLAASLNSAATTPIHRDFYPDQILFGGDEATFLIDLDLYAMGDPAVDVGNFIAHLRELSLRKYGHTRAFEDEVRRFRQTYLDLSGLPLERTIRIYSWLALLRHTWISTRMPDRNSVTEKILETCECVGASLETSEGEASQTAMR